MKLMLVPLAALLVITIVVKLFRRNAPMTIGDLTMFLCQVRLGVLESLFDAEEEARLRATMPTKVFRSLQHKRLRAASAQIVRVLRNATFLLDWGRSEFSRAQKNPAILSDNDEMIVEVIQRASEVRWCALVVLAKIVLWRLMGVGSWIAFPIPSLYDLRQVAELDILRAYERLVSSAANVGLHCYGNAEYEQLLASL